MLRATTNKNSRIELHNGRPHIRTEIVILSPITDIAAFKRQMDGQQPLIQKVLQEIDANFKDALSEDFGANVEKINSTIKNL